ncbi:MAG TPA: patatin-like phospholipase family protein [Streptosporangiaceae bacterium]|nr:patatin-like phospholipase family protein [Streptosporangiaceae bacterium]
MGESKVTGSSWGSGSRIGLVLGAGGVLGAAWMTGLLPSLQERLPGPVGDLDVIVGTSAGSVITAALRCGVSIEDMLAYQRGEAAGLLSDPTLQVLDGPLPPLPSWRVGSPALVRASLRRPHQVSPWVAATGWLPRGRGRHVPLRAMVDLVYLQARQQPGWQPEQPGWVMGRTWICTVDYDSGRRVIFGRDGSPPAPLPDAVVASCSIPGWYEPVPISGRRYVDGGVCSVTSLDLMAEADVDHVYVLAPMASVTADHPRRRIERAERRIRRLITRGLLNSARDLRSRGIRVTVLTPGPEDLAAIGWNLMDPRRRQAVLETSLRTSPAALAAAPSRVSGG